MHIACHIRECIEDYGPIHGFWLFSFERYNGLLENQPFNNRSIEIQLMRRFLQDGCFDVPPQLLSDHFHLVLDRVSVVSLGSVGEVLSSYDVCFPKPFILPKRHHKSCFDDNDLRFLKQLYQQLYSNQVINFLCSTYRQYDFVVSGGHRIYACKNLSKPTVVLAKWDEELLGDLPNDSPPNLTVTYDPTVRPVIIQFFFVHSISVGACTHCTQFVKVLWLKCYFDIFKLGKPVQLWLPYEYVHTGVSSFLPITYLYKPCAYTYLTVSGQTLIALLSIV